MNGRDEDNNKEETINLVDPSHPEKKGIAMKEADILEDNDPERAVQLFIIFYVERKKTSKDYTYRSRRELQWSRSFTLSTSNALK